MLRISRRATRVTFCTALATALCVPASAAPGEQVYYTITLKEALISGAPTASPAGKGEQIEIHSFQWGSPPQAAGSATGGAGSGKVKFNEFTIKKTTDKASPASSAHGSGGGSGKVSMRDMDPIQQGASGEKGGTEDINIGVGELQESTISKSMDRSSAAGGVSVAAGDVTGDGQEAPRKPTIGRATISPKSLPGAGGNDTLTVDASQTESGQATGKRQHKPFVIRTYYDAPQGAGPGSLTVRGSLPGCTVGKRYAEAQFAAAGKSYRLEDVEIADCGRSAGPGDEGPEESITFVYGKIVFK